MGRCGVTANVTIIIATFGDPVWKVRAASVALPSAAAQPCPALVIHGATLAQARNWGAAAAATEWLCFLDADDELGPGYIEAMLAARGDLRAPALHLVHPDRTEIPDLTNRDIITINPCPIGTLIRREMFFDVGGFWEERAWEDWSLFRRCWLAGATISHVSAAVYLAHQDPQGRNVTVEDARQLHRDIIRSHVRWLNQRVAA